MIDYNGFHGQLKAWYDAHGRKDLPWRTTSDPYHVYISEVMLQQTQVKTVLERFYFPFLEMFPTLQALADAPEYKVLKAWEGLGYYSRARNLHKAAKEIVCSKGMVLRAKAGPKRRSPAKNSPSSMTLLDYFVNGYTLPSQNRDPDIVASLMALPGIGRNTAHAIAALAFHQPVAVMEANLKRVLCRIFALESATDKALWEHAERLLNHDDPFTYNQAMMDIGATICSPKTPTCSLCPANTICEGKDDPERYPQKKVKKATPTRQKIILIVADTNGRIHCTPRKTRFLGGLYHFCELDADTETHTVMGETSSIKDTTYIGTIRHSYSHFKLEADVHYTQLSSAANSHDWHTPHTIASLPLSRADQKAWQLFQDQQGVVE